MWHNLQITKVSKLKNKNGDKPKTLKAYKIKK